MILFFLCVTLIHTVFSVCPTGMYELKSGGCIHLSPKSRNFENAESYCTGMGGWLTTLSSECTHEVLSAMASVEFVDEPRARSFIGVKLSKDTDKYVNFDGSEPEQNITVIGHEECVSLNTFTKELETVDCDEKLPFFCTIMASGGTLFFRDNTEYFCAVSKNLGCHRRGTIFCPEGWIFAIETNNCYYLGGEGSVTFAEAASTCTSMNSHLVSIENDVEFAFLQSLVPQSDNCELIDGTWIGLCRKGGKDVWSDRSKYEIASSFCSDEDDESPIDHEGHCAVMPGSFEDCYCSRDKLAYQDKKLFAKNFVCKQKSLAVRGTL